MKEGAQTLLGLLALLGFIIGCIWFKGTEGNQLSAAIQIARLEEEDQGYYSADTMITLLDPLMKELTEKMRNMTLSYRQKQRDNYDNLTLWLEINLEYQKALTTDGINNKTSILRKWGLSEDVWDESVAYNYENKDFLKKLTEISDNYEVTPHSRELNASEMADYVSAQIEFLETKQQDFVTIKNLLGSDNESLDYVLWSRVSDYVYRKIGLESEGFNDYITKYSDKLSSDPKTALLFAKLQRLVKREFPHHSEEEKLLDQGNIEL